MPIVRFFPCGLLFLAIVATPSNLIAQKKNRPQVRAVFVAEAPEIDGRLEEGIWQAAGLIDGLTQVEPVEGQIPRMRTQVRILYTQTHLYLGFDCEETNPQDIILQQMRRDGAVRSDDRVAWLMDTFDDHHKAYLFEVTAAGGRRDSLVSFDGLTINRSWDGYWHAATQVNAKGWSAEVVIPFGSIVFSPNRPWGFNVERFRGKERTIDRWTSATRARKFVQVTSAGLLVGIENPQQGLGMEFKPYAKVFFDRDVMTNTTAIQGNGGGDFTWRITPGLTGAITLNTDFAETEVDDQQINLTRFPLFFPEKRDFFLEDAPLFEIGPVGLGANTTPDLLPFFSRTIGLFNGQEVPLEGGVRLGGRAGPLEVGVLAVRTEQSEFQIGPATVAVPSSDLTVIRPNLSLSKEMRIGAFLATGDPTNASTAQTIGGDFRYLTSGVLGGAFGLNVFALRTYDGLSSERDLAYGMQAGLQTRDWNIRYETLAIGQNFRPALGFVRRRAIHKHQLLTGFLPRPNSGPIRRYFFRVDPTIYADLSNDIESYRVPVQVFGFELHSGDQVALSVIPEGDRPEIAFAPVPTSVIPAGEYDWLRGQISVSTSTNRPLSASALWGFGSWYDGGSLQEITVSGEWRPSRHLRFRANYIQNHADLPGGDFTARIEQVNFDWLFSSEVYWENLLQSDNISRTLGLQSRLRYIRADGQEAFLVLNYGWQDDTQRLIPTRTDLTLKLVYSLRF